ncbi:uncharacterized protein LOC130739062 [Lotus japonicus]|uniref:uncharacterized protein LOC130739062 n=1 Tax=Lotus japonicus TaxID=34305 RepID=UPI00258F0DA6|nr:uncharacterized protein LOC130739062 [Lotus japonicus]
MHQAQFNADRGNLFDHLESSNIDEEPNKDAKRFYGLLKDAEEKLYPGCQKFSKLSFIMRLFQMKCVYGWSNTSFDSLIKLLVEALPDGNVLPNSMYEVRKIIRDFGLDYVKIDACINDCILFRGELYKNLDKCPICGESRWQESKKKNDVPNKNKRIDDGVMRHPVDSLTWQQFDKDHETFAFDPRNVRLGLASDGFNPFGIMSTSYSVWPVVLIPYNLPPLLCMKQPNIILSLLISGPKSPRIDIDVYLLPLIDDLKELWDVGIETYDASSRQNFQLRAALLWTINDFPAYAMLSGWSTKGRLACPCCHSETFSCRLKYGHKQCYMGHLRFLPTQHLWRTRKSSFDNTKEVRIGPKPLTGYQVLAQFESLEHLPFGKVARKRKRISKVNHNWKKKSIFFELPYWRTLELRHNIDVMHVEKNICESVIGTLLDIEGKTKDTIKSRLDLKRMGLKKQLHAIKIGDKYIIPPACYTMSKAKKSNFCRILKDVRFPDAYASNVGRCVNINELKVSGLKSHDYHVILERLLPLAIRGLLPKDACDPLVELSLFFGDLCSKELKVDELDRLQDSIEVTLCKLERIFPPSFFYVMVHLSIHLTNEAKLGGHVQYRWMYPIERYLRILKSYVRNKARPEGSIAEGYVAEECITFCARYLIDMDSRLNRPDKEHLTKIRNESHRNIEKRHREQFHGWFQSEVVRLQQLRDGRISNQLLALSRGPNFRVFNHKGYILNGFKFRTKDAEKHLKTQNSGVLVKGDELTGNVDYYGVVRKITEIKYLDNNSVILFNCDCDREDWHTVVKVKPRHIFALPNGEFEDDDELEAYQLNELSDTHEDLDTPLVDRDEGVLNRDDVTGQCLDESIIEKEEELKEPDDASDFESDTDEESDTSEKDYSEKEDSDTE